MHVITKGDVGGAQTHVVELAGEQVRSGRSVVVVAGTDGPAIGRCRAAGCDVRVVPSLGRARARLGQREALHALRAVIDELDPDVVHAHSSNAGFVARLACRRSGTPCVYTAHGWPFQRGAAWRQRVLSFVGEFIAGRLGDGVICLTDAEAQRALRARVVRRDRLWVVANGLADDVEPVRRVGDGTPRLVMVARFAPPKLQRELIDVMSTLLDLRWSLTFVGDGPELAASHEHGIAALGDRVSFAGHRDDMAQVLAMADVSVLWSRYEGMPISVLEAMRAGLCCVASDLPGVRALFGDPPCGLVAADEAELARVLRRVVSEPEVRRALGVRARTRFEQSFSSTAMAASIDQVYGELLSRRVAR